MDRNAPQLTGGHSAARWPAVGLGCVSALGLQVLFGRLAERWGVGSLPLAGYVAEFVALALAGYVAGHLAGRWHALNGALAAVAYIFVYATITAVREVSLARQVGPSVLVPIDFLRLMVDDLVAMTGATLGGWLASAGAGAPDVGRPDSPSG
jgi:hypothetical protein